MPETTVAIDDARADACPVPRAHRVFAAAAAMILLAGLPDAMVVPLLEGLLVDRYGVSAAAAHWFMAVNVLGGVLALPLIGRARRAGRAMTLLAAAALADGVLLAVMALPLGFAGTLAVRAVEGAADLTVFAVLFDVVAFAGPPARRGRRLGLAATLLLAGLGMGMALGGRIGAAEPTRALVAGGFACGAVALVALLLSRRVVIVPARPAPDRAGGRLWPVLLLAASDRAVGAVLASTLSLHLADGLGLAPARIGAAIGASILFMAAGGWPAGALGDRVGHRRLRLVAGIAYAGLLATLPAVGGEHPATVPLLLAGLGIAGAPLLPTSLALAGTSGRGPVAMGGLHAAGSAGFVVGVTGAATMAAFAPLGAVLATFAGLHLLATAVAIPALPRDRAARQA